jgi:alpha-ribazole phosphatase
MQNTLKRWLDKGDGKKIILLRHGEVQTDGNNARRFIGQVDLPLSDMGRRQAKYWREQLSDVPLAQIISSDLSRCMETASIIAGHRSLDVAPQAGLREIQLGRWDGLTFRQVRERWPDAFRQRGMQIAGFQPPGGESFKDLQQRVVPVFEKVVDQSGMNILIVAHAGVNRMILCHLLGMPPENLFRLAQDWSALNLIERQAANGFRIQSINLQPG